MRDPVAHYTNQHKQRTSSNKDERLANNDYSVKKNQEIQKLYMGYQRIKDKNNINSQCFNSNDAGNEPDRVIGENQKDGLKKQEQRKETLADEV